MMIEFTELFQIYNLSEMSLSAELFLSCSILQFTFYGISTAYQRKSGFILLNKQVYYIGTLFIILSLFLLLNEDLLITNSLSSNNFIINDYFSFSVKLIISLTSILFLLTVNISVRDEPKQNNFEYLVLITISILGLFLLCSSNDLMTAYLSIELQSVAFYIMSAFKRNSGYSIESGLKYFIIGSLSSAFFLFGSSILYGCFGSLNFDDFQMFTSLLFVSSDEISQLYDSISKILCLNEFIFFCSYNLFGDNFLNTYFISSKEVVTYTTVFPISNFDDLIGWSNKFNGINSVSSTIPERLLEFYFQQSPEKIVLNSQIFSISEIESKYFSICQNFNSFNLSLMDSIYLNKNLSLIGEIFNCYHEADSIIFASMSSLNLDFISIGFMLICVSLFIKLSIAPFHFWSLDVYEGSPNITTFFFSVIPKIGLFILLMRLCYMSFYQIFIDNYQIYFFLFSVTSIFVGSFGGLEQRKLKTLLAYSSIGHTGYLLLSLSTGNVEGLQMLFYYLFIYMLSGLCFWSIYLFLKQRENFYFNKSNKELGDLLLLKESNPMLALILSIVLFSIAGIPPMIGFLAKVGIFSVVIKSSTYLIAVLSILFSVISTFYYIRLIKILYFENTIVGRLYLPIDTQKSFLISILSLLLIILCLDPTIIYLLFVKASLLLI